MLSDIHTSLRRSEDDRRRLDTESQLYNKWRLGDKEVSILRESKSDHEAMAKMNWLDKQVSLLYFLINYKHSMFTLCFL